MGSFWGSGGRTQVAQGPGTTQSVDVEELDGVEGDIGGVGSKLSVNNQEQEVLAELFFGEEVGGCVIVASELVDGADVGLLGATGEAAQLHGLRSSAGVTGSWEHLLSWKRITIGGIITPGVAEDKPE